MLKTLSSFLPSFTLLTVITGIYTALVFGNHPMEVATNHSQNFKVAKKLSAEKLSIETVTPLTVASPLETE